MFWEVISYRRLIYAFIRKDFLVRYAQTFLGYFWAVMNPLITVLMLTFAFGVIGKVDTGALPHHLFTLGGTGAWLYLSSAISEGASSIVGARGMITKVYFPRIILPLSKSIIRLIEFGIITLLTILFTWMSGYPVSVFIFWLPLIFIFFVFTSFGLSLWISALSLRFIDILFLLPAILRIRIFIKPITYPTSMVPEPYLLFYFLNPFSGMIELYRWAIFATPLPDFNYLAISLLSMLLITILGMYFFRRTERKIADII